MDQREKKQARASRLLYGLTLLFVMLCFTWGCRSREEEAVAELEYTVVAEAELPQELKTIIDEKKNGEFRLTYMDGDYLYIAVGYGKQATGGYSIQIPRVYLTKDNIVFESQLLGPAEEAQANISYPYAVIKTEKREEPVIFQ